MKTRSKLVLLLLAALAVRVGWCWWLPVDEQAMARSLPDQWEYLQIGRHALAGEGFSFFDFRFQERVYAFRTPGYPAFIALCGGSVRAVRMMQSAVDVSTVLATFLLARRWLSERTALVSAAVVAFNPFLIFFCAVVLTETLFTAMLAWAMVLFSHTKRESGLCFVAGAGLLSASILVRPSAIGLPLLLGLGGMLAAGASARRFGLGAVASAGLAVLVLLPWAVRNRSLLGAWIWTATNSGFTLYDGFNPDADGSSDQSFVARMPQLQELSEVERNAYLSRSATDWARRHPIRSIQLAGRKIARTWSPVPLSSEFGRLRYVLIGAAFSVPLFLAVLAALFLRRLPWRTKAFLLMPAIYFSATQMMSVGSLRYRIPAEPALAVLAASAFSVRPNAVRTRDGEPVSFVPES